MSTFIHSPPPSWKAYLQAQVLFESHCPSIIGRKDVASLASAIKTLEKSEMCGLRAIFKRVENRQLLLHEAVLAEHLPMMACLIICRANPNQPDYWGNTPLHLAALKGDLIATAFLVRAGAAKTE